MELVILNIIKQRIKNIIDGYKIIPESYESDGCDESGILYWVDCYNGISVRSYKIRSMLNNSLEKLFLKIIFEGIIYKSNKYYIDSKFIKNYKNLLVNDIIILKPDEIINNKNNYNIYKRIYNKIEITKQTKIQLYNLSLFRKSLFESNEKNKDFLYHYLNKLQLDPEEKKILEFPKLNWIENYI